MLRYVLYRLLASIPVIIGVTLLVFLLVRLVPGDPIQIMFGNQSKPSPQQIAKMRHQLGLDLPIYEQYGKFMWDALHGNLGVSYRSQQPVATEIIQALPNTIKLTVASLIFAMILGVSAGILSATFKGSIIDTLSMLIAILGVSIPGFWLGLMVILLFAVHLGWFPASGAGSFKNLILPAFTLGVLASAILARITRAAMLDALNQDYVRTARAKGVSAFFVVVRHALRNALIPIVTILGLQVGGLLSGAFIIESVFAYPGVGLLAVTALQTRDFPIIQGDVLLVALIYVFVNLIVDVLYASIDPRVSYH